jgi:alkylated DNA repair protein (DNA oxidative demethylase)
MNWYDATAGWACIRIKDEGPAVDRRQGCRLCRYRSATQRGFCFGGIKRRDPIQSLLLESGDIFVFGGAARLRYHGVSRIVAGTAPRELGIEGRFNLTFRKY